jgi:hypothetical protein
MPHWLIEILWIAGFVIVIVAFALMIEDTIKNIKRW